MHDLKSVEILDRIILLATYLHSDANFLATNNHIAVNPFICLFFASSSLLYI
jgi:hypothetical protein